VYEGYFNYAHFFNAWPQDVFPNFVSSSVSFIKIYNFHCKNIFTSRVKFIPPHFLFYYK
jgi:hypothetical protein